MTYIGATLYAPGTISHETFKDVFDKLTAASFEVDEPATVGKGEYLDTPSMRLKVKTHWIEESELAPLEEALSSLFFDLPVTIEAVGESRLVPKENFLGSLSVATELVRNGRAAASQMRQEREVRDARRAELSQMSDDELAAQGYDDHEAREMLEGRQNALDPSDESHWYA